jgi:hypothetical protein
MTDLYRLLGVSRSATAAEIKSAYRRLAREYHPDVSASPDANTRFVQIGEAYRILSEPRLREIYDRGELISEKKTFYASRAAEVVAYQRKFDRVVDEMMALERQESDARSHAVFVVVTLFVSVFYVAFAKPMIIQDLNLFGRIIVIAVAVYGVWYLLRNLSIVLARYTYKVPDRLISVFREDAPRDKLISRQAGLVFIVSGYLVSVGLGIILSRITRLYYGPPVSPGLLLGIFLYPPIAVLIIGSFRRLGGFLDRG